MKSKMVKAKLAIATLAVTAVLSGCGQAQESAGASDVTVASKEEASSESVTEKATGEESLYDQVGGKLYVGDEFTLGTYEQDNNTGNGAEDIEWIVVEKKGDNEYLCVSKYVLDAQVFGKDGLEIRNRWSTSHLREWLNKDFYNTAFTSADKKNLVEMSKQYPTWQTVNDTDFTLETTDDMVRVLGYGELKDFPGCVKVTEYAKAQGAPCIDDGTREHENCSDGWYLMSFRRDQVQNVLDKHGSESFKGKDYTLVTGYAGTNLSIAVYRHTELLRSQAYIEKESVPTSKSSREVYLEGVRPVIAVKLDN